MVDVRNDFGDAMVTLSNTYVGTIKATFQTIPYFGLIY